MRQRVKQKKPNIGRAKRSGMTGYTVIWVGGHSRGYLAPMAKCKMERFGRLRQGSTWATSSIVRVCLPKMSNNTSIRSRACAATIRPNNP